VLDLPDQPLVPRSAVLIRSLLNVSTSLPAVWSINVPAAFTTTRRTRPAIMALMGSPRRRIAIQATAARMYTTATQVVILPVCFRSPQPEGSPNQATVC
jgi:hypothetical protein